MDLIKELNGHILTLRINRPDARNAMNPAVMGGLGNGLNEAENNSDIRAVIITATGDRAFCAGMDLKGFAEGTNTVGADLEAGFKHFINWSSLEERVLSLFLAFVFGNLFNLLFKLSDLIKSFG